MGRTNQYDLNRFLVLIDAVNEYTGYQKVPSHVRVIDPGIVVK